MTRSYSGKFGDIARKASQIIGEINSTP